MQKSTNSTFYDVLGIPESASKSEIKKSYYDLARKYHPDKNKDENAGDLFKAIAEAYMILSDDQKRKEYNQLLEHKSNVEDFIEKFRKIFGGKQFQNYVGDMIFLSEIRQPTPDDEEVSIFSHNGVARILKITKQLEERVEFFINGEKKNFKIIITDEAKKMCALPNESALLSLLGYMYVREANKHSTLGSIERINSNKYFKKELELLEKLKIHIQYMSPNDQMVNDFARGMIFNGIWLTGRLEINLIIKEVCKRFFDVPEKKLKRKRIQAVKTMGKIFLKYGKSNVDIDIILKLFESQL
ncbi:hypothetical protein ACTA71_009318 [Dictyostelium dimigraforme]